MSKKTRKAKARELLELIGRGPALDRDTAPEDLTRLWLSTWVLPLVASLIPECRDHGMTMTSKKQEPRHV